MKVRDVVFGPMAKERPRLRKTIVVNGVRPCPTADNWNGQTALDKNGREVFLSEGARAQMRRMICEGYWRMRGEVIHR